MGAPGAYRALYLHVPFCRSKCLYCDFESRGGACADEVNSYLDQLETLLDAHAEAGELDGIETVYIGGGTPSLAGMRLAQLVSRVRSVCDPVELTCEANPESFDQGLAEALRAAGATRISLGVQSLVDPELRAIGRIHSADQALEALGRAKDLGFSVSCDLMCGLPGQTLASWRQTLDALLAGEQRPDHVSVYPLQLEEGTPLELLERRGDIEVPDEDFQAACMELASRALGRAGFERYEVASYAAPGHQCRHNIAYWTGRSYLGLGRSAAGMLDLGERGRDRVRQLDDAGAEVEREHLTAREAAAEDLMLACRMVRGITPELIERAARFIPREQIDDACDQAIELGLASWQDGRLAPTEFGWLEGNELFGIFWALA